jgi:hypothetical protein
MTAKLDAYLEGTLLKKEIIKHVEDDRYRLTLHAVEELKKDDLDLIDALYVLKTGQHNLGKTRFDTKHQTWNYAIEGKTEDFKDVRVIIAFVDEMLIITVMEL